MDDVHVDIRVWIIHHLMQQFKQQTVDIPKLKRTNNCICILLEKKHYFTRDDCLPWKRTDVRAVTRVG